MDMIPCPQCGEFWPRSQFREGVCRDCAVSNEALLVAHNAAFDRWERLPEKQRDNEIREAIRRES